VFIIAMALLGVGYTLAYWGANNIKHWDGPTKTDAAPMTLLFGIVDPASSPQLLDQIVSHPVPFPYNAPETATNPTPGSKNSDGTTNLPTPGGGSIAVPNSAGGSGGAKLNTNSPIPGGVDVQGGNYNIPGL
jgi:hypothetical protein